MSIHKNVNTCEFLSDEAIVNDVRKQSSYANSKIHANEAFFSPPTNLQTNNRGSKYFTKACGKI